MLGEGRRCVVNGENQLVAQVPRLESLVSEHEASILRMIKLPSPAHQQQPPSTVVSPTVLYRRLSTVIIQGAHMAPEVASWSPGPLPERRGAPAARSAASECATARATA